MSKMSITQKYTYMYAYFFDIYKKNVDNLLKNVDNLLKNVDN